MTLCWTLRKKVTGPKWAWYEMLALPDMMGTPSRRGRGTVRAIPTLVPTQRRPLEAIREVTWIERWGWDTSLAASTLETLDAMLMSWNMGSSLQFQSSNENECVKN